MNEQQNNSQSPQGDDYIKLGQLLKKSRTPEQNQAIEKILNSTPKISDQIQKISLYDEECSQANAKAITKNTKQTISISDSTSDINTHSFYESEGSDAADKKRVQALLTQNHIITNKAAMRNMDQIKRRMFRLPYLFFMFGEFKKIKLFARETRTIVARFFPPRVRVDANLRHQLLSIIQKDAADLYPYLDKMLSIAWQVLEKQEYNLIVRFQDLCISLANTKFNTWDLNNPHVLDNLLSLERLFLVCYQQPEYPELIINTIDSMMKKSAFDKEVTDRLSLLVRRILLPEETRPSFYYFILACNMVKFRKYITLKELLNTNTQNVINNFYFDCNPKVKIQITQFIRQKSELLEHFAREKYEIEKVYHFLVKFIKEDEEGYDFRILSAFYAILSDKEQFDFNNDQSRLEKLIPRFISGFLDHFEVFLTGFTKIEAFGTIKIFDQEYAGFEIAKTHSFLEKLYKELFNCPQMTLNRFLSLKKKKEGKGASSAEMSLVQIIEELGDIIVELGKKLSEILVHYRHPDKSPGTTDFSPLSPSVELIKQAYIPFWDARIISDLVVGNKSTREVIQYIVHICLVFGLLLQNQNLFRLLDRKNHVTQEYNDLNTMLKRVADIITYDKIIKNLSEFPF